MHNRTTGTARLTSRRRRTAAALLCAAGLALSATACNEDLAQDGGSSQSPAKDQQPSASASKGTDQGGKGEEGGKDGDKAVDGDAGKTLPLGQPTALTYRRANKTATLEIAAKSVRKGTQADLANLTLDAKAKTLQPYYVTMTFKNIGDKSLHYPFLNTPTSVRDGQGNQGKVLITPDDAVASCPGKDPDDFAAGAKTTLCKIFLLPKSETPSVVLYTGDFDKDPVYWKATQG